jgi:hypothetical protein
MLAVFLPVGLILRSFHFTRGVGALFIAVAVGFYFVFPYVFVLTDPSFVKLPPLQQYPQIAGNFCYPTLAGAVAFIATSGAQSGSSVGAPSLQMMSSQFGRLYAALLIHPLIALFITLIVIRYLMYLFGEEGFDVIRAVGKAI